MGLLICKISGAAGVGTANSLAEGVLGKLYVPNNLPAGAAVQIEEVVLGVTHVLYTFTDVTSPSAPLLQRQSKKSDGTDSGSFEAELVGGHLQIRGSGLGAGDHSFALLML